MHICITAAMLPQTTTHDIKLEDFESDIKVFELLAAMEDEYVDSLSAAISEAFDNKNWETLSYLNNVLDKVDHIACRAHSAVNHTQTYYLYCHANNILRWSSCYKARIVYNVRV